MIMADPSCSDRYPTAEVPILWLLWAPVKTRKRGGNVGPNADLDAPRKTHRGITTPFPVRPASAGRAGATEKQGRRSACVGDVVVLRRGMAWMERGGLLRDRPAFVYVQATA